ncbi:MAG: PDZ domain-containing protein [Planctomycetes bacterium]|nr:PDZ domain-containing protein [Planctomycetota bacterium]
MTNRSNLAAGSWFLFASLLPAQTTVAETSDEASRYLDAALDAIEQNSRVYTTDWKALRAKAHATIAAAGAKTPADTYAAIRAALTTLGDRHGLLLDPAAAKAFNPSRTTKATGMLVVPQGAIVAQVVPGSPAEAAGLALGDRIVAVDGLPAFTELPTREFERLFRRGQYPDGGAAPLDLRVRTGTTEPRDVQVPLATFDAYVAPTGRRLDGGIGYLELPGVLGPKASNYDDAVHELLDSLDDGTLRGCIIDLRRNTGGTLWPMLAGIGPLAGTGRLGAFASAKSEADWSYDADLGIATSATHELAKVAKPHPLRADLPVAVLTGPLTAGAGEALVVAFAGRARARRFGEGTRGLPTSNTQKPLADGALLVVTVTVHADRTGTRYDGVIPPDETVASDWERFGKADDPVVAAACRWLASAGNAR